ncbi:MAG: S4 domain-containing protein [Litorivicinaceae bacterium]|jgi:ribosome-associated heat shock protein Hsp15|nr:S4 domain-containing protein [Litorivicinaceae bacterium]MDP5329881.1 S4 domain-containing protein [Litorivicinaceae bacterium]MDP5340793.1 S4 domain-containing protein [Litorivicinaceae bacterium]MDP5341469.1 S4 domain-containing protein [Litorivicinaceae bacterium]MDP5344403.1 S4 domain-containing protein [Litorivicinaceae bacterium]
MSGVRLDKWLWAARFFKTRGLARDAIDGGKIRIGGVKAKPAKDVTEGMEIVISRHSEEITVVVQGVREDRRPAQEAQQLYAETEASRAKREQMTDAMRAARAGFVPADHRPNKRERRQMSRLKELPHAD